MLANLVVCMLASFGTACGEEKNEIPANLLKILEQAETLTLYSIAPAVGADDKKREVFHGFEILGKTDIAKADERKKIVTALKDTLQKGLTFTVANCFQPRHAIRAVLKAKIADVLICFECMQAYLFDTAANDARRVEEVYVNSNARDQYNKILTTAGVKLAPGAEGKK